MNKSSYYTWYEFKKDLERRSNHSILNKEWLEIKPHQALPWDDSSIQSTLLKVQQCNKKKAG
jgi:hypothetical protein